MSESVSESAGFLPDIQGWLATGRQWAEGRLAEALERLDLGPEPHASALRYALLGGGKRLRPCLVRLICSELGGDDEACLLYTSPSPRDLSTSRMPSSA